MGLCPRDHSLIVINGHGSPILPSCTSTPLPLVLDQALPTFHTGTIVVLSRPTQEPSLSFELTVLSSIIVATPDPARQLCLVQLVQSKCSAAVSEPLPSASRSLRGSAFLPQLIPQSTTTALLRTVSRSFSSYKSRPYTASTMTVDSVVEAAPPAVDAVHDPPTSPRKRRRRAPTTGAADDCFACQEHHATCDRRRPYCTQCIERGKTCSGYKTTLTWGVGVASRGKLRGLSLPVAKSRKVDPADKENGKKGGGAPALSKSRAARESAKQEVKCPPFVAPLSSVPASKPISPPTTFGFVNVDPNAPAQSPSSQHASFQWPRPQARSQESTARAQERRNSKRAIRRHTLQPLSMPPVLPIQDYSPVPASANAFGRYGDSPYEHAIEFSPSTPLFRPSNDLAPMMKGAFAQHSWSSGGNYPSESAPSQHSISSWPSETVSSSLGSDLSSRDYQEEDVFHPDPAVASSLDHVLGELSIPRLQNVSQANTVIKEEATEDQAEDIEEVFYSEGHNDDHDFLSMQLSQSIPSQLVGSTRALRELINYYDQVISPVIVAFDGPSNPYRIHILRLASESEALQHAIAALSASNLRMRRDYEQVNSNRQLLTQSNTFHETPHDASVRKSSLAHNLLRDSLDESELQTGPGRPSRRELYHKGESIRALNTKLRDQSVRDDDAILATLLVLCLYHICDTGIAKFRTQFAGVKKILALRNKKSASKETRWLITMFRWFDAMTATVNDREGQFEDDCIDHDMLEPDEWSLENLAGCDGRLFNTISRLGRLNLLSQGKPVDGPTSKTRPLAPRQPGHDYYSMHPGHLDGNGWTSLESQPADVPNSRTDFFTEWSSIRQELVDWRFDPSNLPLSMQSPSFHDSDINTVDLNNISECFRYSALLYTERLAYPSTSSSAQNFQSLVDRAIHHIKLVKSDVFLLWPLFITGTECVLTSHRDLVRKRCLAIQEDSGFFNNMSTLTLLERIWSGNEGRETTPQPQYQQQPQQQQQITYATSPSSTSSLLGAGCSGAFKWRKAMETVDGEYIVI